MPVTKAVISERIVAMRTKLEETKNDAGFNRGPVNDALQVVIPMMEDQLKLLEDLLELFGY